jgi:EpsI family protein
MIGTPTIRVYLMIVAIGAAYGGSKLVQTAITQPEVAMPSWSFDELPMQLGDWLGEDTALDPKITAALKAERVKDRIYQDSLGHVISLHTAMFKDAVEGVYHTPINCYRANGWDLKKDVIENLRVSDDLTIPVRVLTYEHEKDRQRVMVAYWYQLGEHVLFGRWDLGVKVRLSLRGRPTWPALVKVMVQIPVADTDDAKAALLAFVEFVAKWENQPERRKELL